jgi:hypothetical protein
MGQGWLDFIGDSSYALLTGLDVAKSYDITLFGSCTDANTGNESSRYSVTGGNGLQSGILDAQLNTSGTLTFFGVKPNPNGQIWIGLAAYDSSNSAFAVLSDIVIKGYTPSTNSLTQPPAEGTQQMATGLTGTASVFAPATQDSLIVKPLTAYPNPFHQSFNLMVPATAGDNIVVTIRDAGGKFISGQRFDNLYQGDNVIQILPGQTLAKGLYFVTVLYLNENKLQVIKMLRE